MEGGTSSSRAAATQRHDENVVSSSATDEQPSGASSRNQAAGRIRGGKQAATTGPDVSPIQGQESTNAQLRQQQQEPQPSERNTNGNKKGNEIHSASSATAITVEEGNSNNSSVHNLSGAGLGDINIAEMVNGEDSRRNNADENGNENKTAATAIKSSSGRRARKMCKQEGCRNLQRSFGYCISHGGGTRCASANCKRGSKGPSKFCVAHGGGKRCQVENCKSSAIHPTLLCYAHGGGRRCRVVNCSKMMKSSSSFCNDHQAGVSCSTSGCKNVTEASGNLHCNIHGGVPKCSNENCKDSVTESSAFCLRHATENKLQNQIDVVVSAAVAALSEPSSSTSNSSSKQIKQKSHSNKPSNQSSQAVDAPIIPTNLNMQTAVLLLPQIPSLQNSFDLQSNSKRTKEDSNQPNGTESGGSNTSSSSSSTISAMSNGSNSSSDPSSSSNSIGAQLMQNQAIIAALQQSGQTNWSTAIPIPIAVLPSSQIIQGTGQNITQVSITQLLKEQPYNFFLIPQPAAAQQLLQQQPQSGNQTSVVEGNKPLDKGPAIQDTDILNTNEKQHD